jgi:hypothetical protein
MKSVNIEYKSEFQYQVLKELFLSFQGEGVNFDKFLLWVLKNTGDGGSSIILRDLKRNKNED